MQRLDDYNRGLVFTEVSNCINCSKCIINCPALKANVLVKDKNGAKSMGVDEHTCILCGKCLDTCVHNAREYKDDTKAFINSLQQGKAYTMLVAPSFFLNFPTQGAHILGYLKSLGVSEFYPVGFGADIAVWAYIKHIERTNALGLIAQPCPTIVKLIEKSYPALLPNIIPVQSPLICTAIYLKKHKQIKENLAFLSPCISKKVEIESERGGGLVDFNITFNMLMRYIKDEKINLNDFEPASLNEEPSLGALFPNPGGLKEVMEFYLGSNVGILQIDNVNKANKYFSYMQNEKEGESNSSKPVLVDIISCEGGCIFGTGTETRRDDFSKTLQSLKIRRRLHDSMQNSDVPKDPALRLAALNERFKDLTFEDFMCTYNADDAGAEDNISDDEVAEIFKTQLEKMTEDDRCIDCTACGYSTCVEMAKAIAMNINERENCVFYVKNNLAKSEERLRILFDNMPLVANFRDREFNIYECNEEAAKLFDLQDKEEYLQKFFELSPEFQPDGTASTVKAEKLIAQAFETGRVMFEWMHKKLNGEPVPCEITLIRVNWHAGECVLAFVRDLREHYKYIDSVMEIEARLKAMLDASPILCAIFDENCKVLEANQGAADLFGLPDKQIYIERYLDLCPEFQPDGVPSAKKVKAVIKLAFEKGRINFEWMHQTLDGKRQIPCDVVLQRVTLGDKDVVMTYLRDLSEQKEWLAKLEAARDKEQAANQAKSVFLSSMSHEMRTPMNAIIGMANIGKNSTNIKQKDYAFEKIFNASSHLLGVVNDVLDMAKIEANKIELFTTSFNFKLMLKRVVNIVDFLATEKKQELLVNVDPNIPRMVAADEQRLVQVITNLLSNAIKFTPEKGKITLDAKMLTTRADGFDIQISVTDTGIGISKENMRRVFVPFEQADDSTVRSYRGTGLGLAICKSIVSLMGGSIYVNSTVGKGSTFTATVQLGFAQKSNGENKAGTNEAPAAILSKEINILLVEDIEINREIILMQFEESAMRFECALNGKQAVQIFAANPSKYDLILMDIQMPELNGLDATRQIRALNAANAKTIPILALTANVFSDDIAACLEAGMNDHIGKPIDYNIMLEKMHAALQEK